MPKNLIKRAEYKVVKFKKVKDEIDDAITILLEQLQIVRLKIGRHIYSEKDGRHDGVLNHKADDYL